MGKVLIFVVALALVGVIRMSTADLENAKIPFLTPAEAAPKPPANLNIIGTPAAVTLPEADLATFFPAEVTDPTDPKRWAAVHAFLAVTRTPGGWAEACKKASGSAGAERGTNPELGALACSDDPTVTELQRFAVHNLATWAEVALWQRGISGHEAGVVGSRLAEIRDACTNGLPARQPADSVYAQACTNVLAATSLPGDAPALLTALETAYRAIAADLAARDATVDQEPAMPPAAEKKE